jgi:hypothetical protein
MVAVAGSPTTIMGCLPSRGGVGSILPKPMNLNDLRRELAELASGMQIIAMAYGKHRLNLKNSKDR